jgi:hypothetical protein
VVAKERGGLEIFYYTVPRAWGVLAWGSLAAWACWLPKGSACSGAGRPPRVGCVVGSGGATSEREGGVEGVWFLRVLEGLTSFAGRLRADSYLLFPLGISVESFVAWLKVAELRDCPAPRLQAPQNGRK